VQLAGIGPSDWITINARHNPEGQCFVRANRERLSFERVASDVALLAGSLRDAGLERGDRIAALATDSVEYMELMLASMRLGTTIVPLNFRLATDEVRLLLDATQPAALFVSPRYEDAITAGRASLGQTLRLTGGVDGPTGGTSACVRELIESAVGPGVVESQSVDDDILAMPMTSGTTGIPKGVMQSQRMLKAIAMQGIIDLDFRKDDFAYSGASLFHISGMGHLFYLLARGGSSLILPQFDTDEVLWWMQEGGITRCMLIPSMVISLLSHPDVRASRYPQLRAIMYGGAQIAPSTIHEMLSVFDCDLFNGFGAGTEAGGQTMFTPADHRFALEHDVSLLGSIGKPIFGVDLKLCDEEGVEVPHGDIGEIFTRSDTVMSGYFNQPELTARSITEGWFHAGDCAFYDSAGYLRLAGRRNDMIIRGGENVYPNEIEDTLGGHPSVHEVAVIGLPDAYWGEIVAAVVVLRPGASLDLDEAREYCVGKIATYKIPTHLEVVDDFPKNSTGKIVKHELRSSIVARSATAG